VDNATPKLPCYGPITYLTAGNHRPAIVSTVSFSVVGLILLGTVNERRGRAAALELISKPSVM
jgi:UMF1 family MFS transporter